MLIEEYNYKRDENNSTGLEKLLKLSVTKTVSNMHAFDAHEKLVKYNNPEDMVDSYIPVRLDMYEKRKRALLVNMKTELKRLSNKARFITSILDDTIDLRRKSTAEIKDILASMKYDLMEGDPNYNYLIKMPMDSLTTENVDKLLETKRTLELDIKELEGKSCRDIWIHELDELVEKYNTINSTKPLPTKIKKKIKTSC